MAGDQLPARIATEQRLLAFQHPTEPALCSLACLKATVRPPPHPDSATNSASREYPLVRDIPTSGGQFSPVIHHVTVPFLCTRTRFPGVTVALCACLTLRGAVCPCTALQRRMLCKERALLPKRSIGNGHRISSHRRLPAQATCIPGRGKRGAVQNPPTEPCQCRCWSSGMRVRPKWAFSPASAKAVHKMSLQGAGRGARW